MRARTSCVYNTFGNALVVKMCDLFSENKIFQKRSAPISSTQRILVIIDLDSLISGHLLSCGVRRMWS